jgi:hypothetical protein
MTRVPVENAHRNKESGGRLTQAASSGRPQPELQLTALMFGATDSDGNTVSVAVAITVQ